MTLGRTHSNHHLIKFIGAAGEPASQEARPFRFEIAWLHWDNYNEFWKEAWRNEEEDIVGAIENTINQSKEWNNKSFNNIFKKNRISKPGSRGCKIMKPTMCLKTSSTWSETL